MITYGLSAYVGIGNWGYHRMHIFLVGLLGQISVRIVRMVEAKVETRDMRGEDSKQAHACDWNQQVDGSVIAKKITACFIFHVSKSHGLMTTLPRPMGHPGYLQYIITALVIS
jgi:hypothetical protein